MPGGGNEFQVICTGLIARAFQRVGCPIVPALAPKTVEKTRRPANPYDAHLIMRHYSQIMPRDFDISPNFEIIKFNIIAPGAPFDYRTLWDPEAAMPADTVVHREGHAPVIRD